MQTLLPIFIFFSSWMLQSSCTSPVNEQANLSILQTDTTLKKLVLTDTQWRERLSAEAYYVLRKKGTERSFTSSFHNSKRKGNYHCAGCDQLLFRSSEKYDSGTGWPSFFQPAFSNAVSEAEDRSYGSIETEVLCAKCDGHLGHVFKDGPRPTGLRYCINGVALVFKEN